MPNLRIFGGGRCATPFLGLSFFGSRCRRRLLKPGRSPDPERLVPAEAMTGSGDALAADLGPTCIGSRRDCLGRRVTEPAASASSQKPIDDETRNRGDHQGNGGSDQEIDPARASQSIQTVHLRASSP